MNDDGLVEALRGLPPESPAPVDRFDRVRAGAARRRRQTVLAPLGGVAAVAAVVAVVTAVVPGVLPQPQPAQEVAGCPSDIDPAKLHEYPALWVPAPPTDGDGATLVPEQAPSAATVCAYDDWYKRPGDGRLTGERRLTTGLENIPSDLHWAPEHLESQACPAIATGNPAFFLVRLTYPSGDVTWLSTRRDAGRCFDTFNGAFTSSLFIGDQVEASFQAGAWVEAPPDRNGPPPGPCSPVGSGRIGQESSMVPPGATSVSICSSHREDGPVKDRRITDASEVEALTTWLNRFDSTTFRGHYGVRTNEWLTYSLVFHYPQGPDATVQVASWADPPVFNPALEVRQDATDLELRIRQLLDGAG